VLEPLLEPVDPLPLVVPLDGAGWAFQPVPEGEAPEVQWAACDTAWPCPGPFGALWATLDT